jgi:tetratricopeptide (TPR) repeat protein
MSLPNQTNEDLLANAWTQREIAEFQRILELCRPALGRDLLFAVHADVVYERLGQLGAGGFGVVERVRDLRLQRDAALKCLHQSTNNPIDRMRFLREARITAQLDHPCVPKIFEVGKTVNDQLYLVMEVIEGETLHEHIASYHKERCSLETLHNLLEIVIKVSETVAAAHNADIVHRDLKPDNIMVGWFGDVKVLDWGLALNISKTEIQSDRIEGTQLPPKAGLTKTGTFLGTPGYMPAEQIRGEAEGPADVFALGAILTEILTESRPVTGSHVDQVIVATLTGSIHGPRALKSGVPRELDSLARACLQIDPTSRPSAEEVAMELRRYIRGEALHCHRYGITGSVLLGIRKHPMALVVFSIIVLLTVIALGISSELRIQSQRRVRAEAETTAKKRELDISQKSEEKLEFIVNSLLKGTDLARRKKKRALQEHSKGVLEVGGRSSELLITCARLHFECGDFDEARNLLNEILDKNPNHAEALFELLEIETKLDPNLTDSARRLLSRIIEQHEKSNTVDEFTLFNEAQKAVIDEDPRRAVVLLRKAVEKNGRFWWLWMTLGVQHKELKQYDAALQAYDRAQELAPTNHRIMFNRSTLLRILGKASEAKREIDKALSFSPYYIIGLTERAAFYINRSNGALALEDVNKVLSVAPTHAQALALQAAAYNILGNSDQALQSLENALKYSKKNTLVLATCATILNKLKRHKSALDVANTVLALQINHIGALNEKAIALIYLRREQEARHALKQILTLDPKNSQARNNLNALRNQSSKSGKTKTDRLWSEAKRLLAQNNYRAAIPKFNKILAIDSQDKKAKLQRGISYFNLKEFDSAIKDLSALIKIKSQLILAHFYRGLAFSNIGKAQQALSDYQRVIELNPKIPELYLNRANLFRQLGRSKEALASYSQALSLKSNYMNAYFQRARLLDSLNRLKEALVDINKAIALNRRDINLLNFQSTLYLKLGQYKKAILICNEILQGHPTHELSYFNRGQSYIKLGKIEAARNDLARVLQGQDPSLKKKARSILRRLDKDQR